MDDISFLRSSYSKISALFYWIDQFIYKYWKRRWWCNSGFVFSANSIKLLHLRRGHHPCSDSTVSENSLSLLDYIIHEFYCDIQKMISEQVRRKWGSVGFLLTCVIQVSLLLQMPSPSRKFKIAILILNIAKILRCMYVTINHIWGSSQVC